LVGREPTAWLTMQSAANQSPAANSLLTGKLTGNFAEPGHLSQFSYPIDARIQWLTAEFPTQPNREFLKCISADIPRMTPKPAWRVAILQRPWKPDARCGWLPAARAARTMVEGLIWLFSLASGRIPPVDYA